MSRITEMNSDLSVSDKPDQPGASKRPSEPMSSTSTAKPPFNKRPRFNKKNGSGTRHGGVSYSKTEPRVSSLVSPSTSYFLIFTASIGVESFGGQLYDWCVGADYRFGTNVRREQFLYAYLIAYIARLSRLSCHFGYRFDSRASILKQVSEGILLPELACKMIECLGVVRRPNLPTVAPLFTDYNQWKRNPANIDPARFLPIGPHPDLGDWAIDPNYIADYIQRAARAASRQLGFRTVNWDVFEGRVELLWGYSTQGVLSAGDLIPKGPYQISQAEAELAALYCFRNHDAVHTWDEAIGNHLCRPDFIGDTVNGVTLTATLANACRKEQAVHKP